MSKVSRYKVAQCTQKIAKSLEIFGRCMYGIVGDDSRQRGQIESMGEAKELEKNPKLSGELWRIISKGSCDQILILNGISLRGSQESPRQDVMRT